MTEHTLAPPQANPGAGNLAVKRILTAAWLAAGAGVLAQLAVIGVRAWAGGAVPGFLAELAQGVTWSVLVCAAIAVGTLASKARAQIAGALGLLAGPLAWAAAKGVQKGVQALAGAPQDQLTALFWVVCLWKGAEYAALGAGLAMIVGRPDARLSAFVQLGLLVGVMSGCVVIALNIGAADLAGASTPMPRIASLFANEVFFAVACSMVIYTAQMLTRSLAMAQGATQTA